MINSHVVYKHYLQKHAYYVQTGKVDSILNKSTYIGLPIEHGIGNHGREE